MSTVAVLKGGRSLERGVSLRSGAQVQDALRRLGHESVVIDVGPELVARLRESKPDVAFIALHGREGEDGTIQELMRAIGMPYTGSDPSACLRCADKVLAKQLMAAAGIPTPDFYFCTEASFRDLGAASVLPDIERTLGFPVVIKPASQGSALGIQFARSSVEVPSALVAAFSYDRKVLLERHIDGRDLAVSILDSPAGGAPQALPVVEAVPRGEDFYDFQARYEIGQTTFVCPAELPAELANRAQQLALSVYGLLGCHGFARVDLMLAADGEQLSVLETNVVPGLTETSLLPQAADAAGIGFDELVSRILLSADSRPG
ncbi:MAG TPA: D-alanine--D-alanine ligase [Solirubrobacteraceae bacterium]|jgi:D-alanine-D-alanine ligase